MADTGLQTYYIGPEPCTVDAKTHALTQNRHVSVQQHFMSLELAPKHVRNIVATATVPDDVAKRSRFSGRALEVAEAHRHDAPFAASAAILSAFTLLESYDAALCYVPDDIVASLPASLERLRIRSIGAMLGLPYARGDFDHLVNLRTLEIDTPRLEPALAEFRMRLEAALPEGCELIVHA